MNQPEKLSLHPSMAGKLSTGGSSTRVKVRCVQCSPVLGEVGDDAMMLRDEFPHALNPFV